MYGTTLGFSMHKSSDALRTSRIAGQLYSLSTRDMPTEIDNVEDTVTDVDEKFSSIVRDEKKSEDIGWPESLELLDCANAERTALGRTDSKPLFESCF